MIEKILDGVQAVGSSAVYTVTEGARGRDDMLVQVDIGGVATVKIECRVHEDMNWIEYAELTASAITPIARPTQIRVRVSAWTSGTVNAAIAT